MAATMRAKMKVGSVFPRHDGDGNTTCEMVTLFGVSKPSGYPADGSDEDNTYAKFSPSAKLEITIANPALFGVLKNGDAFYVDFTPVPSR